MAQFHISALVPLDTWIINAFSNTCAFSTRTSKNVNVTIETIIFSKQCFPQGCVFCRKAFKMSYWGKYIILLSAPQLMYCFGTDIRNIRMIPCCLCLGPDTKTQVYNFPASPIFSCFPSIILVSLHPWHPSDHPSLLLRCQKASVW